MPSHSVVKSLALKTMMTTSERRLAKKPIWNQGEKGQVSKGVEIVLVMGNRVDSASTPCKTTRRALK